MNTPHKIISSSIGCIILGITFVIAAFFYIDNIQYPRITSEQRIMGEIGSLQAASSAFKTHFGHYPEGSNIEIIEQLSGNNVEHLTFIVRKQFHFNEKGEVVDPTGDPYVFHQQPAGIEIKQSVELLPPSHGS
jgi:hypothetical protein